MTRTTFLRLEWGLSLALVALALAWAAARDVALVPPWATAARDLAAGVGLGALLWLSIPLLRRSHEMRRVWDGVLAPFSSKLGTGDILVIALLSGFAEELFFRGVLLAEVGVIVSSIVFGLLHALNALYAAWATVIGIAFAALVLSSGSLVGAMAAHATYNLGALLVLRHWHAERLARAGRTA